MALVCALGASQILCIAGAARTPNYILEDLRSSMFVFLEVLVMSIRPDGSVPLMFGDQSIYITSVSQKQLSGSGACQSNMCLNELVRSRG